MTLSDKTLFITGGSRGIGEAIAVRAARDGANVALVGKSDRPHPKLPGTLGTAADAVKAAGGRALVCKCDIRFDDEVAAAVDATVKTFGGIDIVVNNASAIHMAGTMDTPMKRYDLMHDINGRGTYLVTRTCLPHLEKSTHPRVLNLAPPLNMEAEWFARHVAYTMAKYAMSMCVLGMSREFQPLSIGVNALWPRTIIATAAVQNLLGGDESMRHARRPEIVADAAHWILTQDASCTGNFFIDEDVLRAAGVTDFDAYAVDPSQDLWPDLFL